MPPKVSLDHLRALEGQELGVSDWQLLDQARIDAFAGATGDHGAIHTRPDSADAQEFGGTIAHGFMTLSLLPSMAAGFLPGIEGHIGLNAGLDRVRFISPVPSGARVRGRFQLDRLHQGADSGLTLRMLVTVEIDGQHRPAMSAIWINRFLPAGAR